MTAAPSLPARRLRSARIHARAADVCAAEWIKFWSLRSTPVALALGVALALCLAAVNSRHGVVPQAGSGGTLTPEQAAFDGFCWLPAMLGAGLIGAQATVGEYASGLIRTTLAAVPDRRRVALAKIAVVAGITGACALVIAAGGLAIALAVVHRPSPGGAQPVRAIWSSVLLLPVCALTGMAFGTLLRHAAGAGVAVGALFGFLPIMLRPDSNRWATDAANALPYYSWGRLTAAGAGADGTMSPTTAWATLAAWAVASIVVTVFVLDRRDV
jgi:ABC-2 type transport system permease protein